MKNTKMPAIRFKGFNDDWEQRKVSKIAIEKLSNGIMNNQSDDETGVKHINVINMYDTDKIHPEKLTFSNYDEEAVKKCNVGVGDIFLTRSSLKPEGIAEANVLLDSGCFVYDDHLIRLKVNKEKYDPFFVKLNLSGNAFKRQFIVRAKTTAFTTIGQEDISECLGFFPKKEEQQQIGEYFMTLDHLITLHQRKLEKIKIMKKSMLEKMFPREAESIPKIRFDGYTDDWEQRKFGDYNDLMTGYPFESDKFSEDGIKLVRGMNVKRGYLDFSDDICMKWNSCVGLENYLLKDGDILIQMDGALIGRSYAKIKEKQLPALLVQRVTRARTSSKSASQDFMYQTIQRDFLRYIEMNKTETAVPHLSLNDIRNFEIMVPGLAEQDKIGTYFSNIDHLITLHQRKLEKLKKVKKSLLEHMFPMKK